MMKDSDLKDRKPEVGNNEDEEDRISSLPDSILCHILSFLPTNYAVATSILSSRWKLLWSSLSNLHFDDRLCSEYKRAHNLTNQAKTRFESFVDSMLLLTDRPSISEFSLIRYSQVTDLSRFTFWVSSAIMRNVREIELKLKSYFPIMLPESIYTCKTLEVLKLKSDFVIKIPSSGVCFPNVKVLYVKIYYPDNNLTERIFSVCPVLEDLLVKAYFRTHIPIANFNISSPTLKSLVIIVNRKSKFGYVEHKFMIKTPNLERLAIQQDDLVSYTLEKLPSIRKVIIDISYWSYPRAEAHRTLQLLKCVTAATSLVLSARTLYLFNGCDKFFPTFLNLTHLYLEAEKMGDLLFSIILSSSPNLEVFVFEKDSECNTSKRVFAWNEPKSVPDCLLFQVKKIEIIGFDGQRGELELVKYLLKNSEVLETMTVRFREASSKEKFRLCERLLKFERGSKTCQIKFI